MGGLGKTELAIQYSLKHFKLNNYPGGICWVNTREQDIDSQIVNFVRKKLELKLPENLELSEKLDWCWQHWQPGTTLIILDDVKSYSNIQPYLPPKASQFKVLITTRLKLELSSSLSLKLLSELEALELLSKLITLEKVNKELVTAKELCKNLGYLPLALQLVGRYIKKRRISLAKELELIKNKKLTNPALKIPEDDPTWTLNIKYGVAAAFELSWERLSTAAQELGCLISLFALAPIPWSLIKSTATEQNKEELETARIELENFHLLQSEEDNYQLHQLIQEFFQDKQSKLATTEKQKHNLCSAMVAIAENISQTITLSQIKDLIPFIPHLTKTANIYQKWLSDQDLLWPFIGIARFYANQGAYEQALPWYKNCLSVTKERLGEEHADVATSLNNLALLYDNQGRYEEAEPLYLEALEMTKKLLGEEHPLVATSLNNLALLYNNQGRYETAEPLYLEALEMRKKLLGEEHADVATSLNNLASLYDNQGRYEEAEPLFLQALELYKKLLGEEHPNVATSLNNLALFCDNQGKYEEAEPLYLEALEIRKKLLGEEHPDIAASLNNLAGLYYTQGRYKEAEPLFLQALELYKKLLGEEHPDVATSLNNLALFYNNQGKYKEAERLYLKALKISKKILGENHPNTITIKENYELLIKP